MASPAAPRGEELKEGKQLESSMDDSDCDFSDDDLGDDIPDDIPNRNQHVSQVFRSEI